MKKLNRGGVVWKYISAPAYSIYERKLQLNLKNKAKPKHIAILCDGNRRWAKLAGHKDVTFGYVMGAQKVSQVINWCTESGIEHVTLYLLSTENLARPQDELKPLLEIIANLVEIACNSSNSYRITLVGSLDLLPVELADKLTKLVAGTKCNSGCQINMAIGYGGRVEIVDAVKTFLAREYKNGKTGTELIESINEEAISENLYTKGQPDPDLVIRTSGEQRLSGFLTWQSTYSEIWFTEAYWPDFRKLDFLRALRDYGLRHRRFGK